MNTRARAARWLGAASWLAVVASGGVARAQTPDVGLAEPWSWHQALASPRIGGRFTAVAVDPSDPARVFVGTEEGTLLRSEDAGATFEEINLSPFVVQRRSVATSQLPAPSVDSAWSQNIAPLTLPPSLQIFNYGAGASGGASFVVSPGATLGWLTVNNGLFYAPYQGPGSESPQILGDVIRSRDADLAPVQQIAVCPGGIHPLIVATTRDLLGSSDGGVTFSRLFSLPDRVLLQQGEGAISQVACSPQNPNEIVIGTAFGLMRSIDGGLTFDENVTGAAVGRVTALTYGPPTRDGHKTLLVASGSTLLIGDPDSSAGLVERYPDFDNTATAPWEAIHWVTMSRSGSVWLATSRGLRVSRDGGHRWETIADPESATQDVRQVAIGYGAGNRERVVVLADQWAHASDDGGRSWAPYFYGLTRRTYRQAASAPSLDGAAHWWVIAGGELWSSAPDARTRRGVPDAAARRWALARIRRTPTLEDVLDEAMRHLALDPAHIAAVEGARPDKLMPVVNVQGGVFNAGYATQIDQRLSTPFRTTAVWSQQFVGAVATLSWFLPELGYQSPTTGGRRELVLLRQQMSYAVEDAWHERFNHLRALSDGIADPMVVETLRARVEVLEVVLETWTGRPLSVAAR